MAAVVDLCAGLAVLLSRPLWLDDSFPQLSSIELWWAVFTWGTFLGHKMRMILSIFVNFSCPEHRRYDVKYRFQSAMVQTSKTDHFFKLAPFWFPLTDLIDFGMAGKLLISATRWCSPFVDSVPRIWIKPNKSLIGCWGPTATTFGQSAPSPVQLTAGRNGHNRHFERLSLVSSVCGSLCTGKIELYVSCMGRVFPWRTSLSPTDGSETRGFWMHGHDLASDCQGYFVKRPRKNTRTQQIYAQTSWQISMTGSSSKAQQTVLPALI